MEVSEFEAKLPLYLIFLPYTDQLSSFYQGLTKGDYTSPVMTYQLLTKSTTGSYLLDRTRFKLGKDNAFKDL